MQIVNPMLNRGGEKIAKQIVNTANSIGVAAGNLHNSTLSKDLRRGPYPR